jgi:hypothetical protein
MLLIVAQSLEADKQLVYRKDKPLQRRADCANTGAVKCEEVTP